MSDEKPFIDFRLAGILLMLTKCPTFVLCHKGVCAALPGT